MSSVASEKKKKIGFIIQLASIYIAMMHHDVYNGKLLNISYPVCQQIKSLFLH